MRHAEAQIAPEAILQAEQVLAHHIPASRLLPDLGRIQRGQQHFLRADGIHLLAHDSRDLQQRALCQEEVAVNTGRKLANVAGSQQQSMACDLGFRRDFA